jgi:hypothetical protein
MIIQKIKYMSNACGLFNGTVPQHSWLSLEKVAYMPNKHSIPQALRGWSRSRPGERFALRLVLSLENA